MDIWYAKKYSVELCREFPDHMFVFGDNLVGRGKGGQAIIRDEPNTFGIPTKRSPSMGYAAFFSDLGHERDRVIHALRELWIEGRCKPLVFPTAGLGTGRARMKELSPELYEQMCYVLKYHFGVENGEYDKTKLLRRHL